MELGNSWVLVGTTEADLEKGLDLNVKSDADGFESLRRLRREVHCNIGDTETRASKRE